MNPPKGHFSRARAKSAILEAKLDVAWKRAITNAELLLATLRRLNPNPPKPKPRPPARPKARTAAASKT